MKSTGHPEPEATRGAREHGETVDGKVPILGAQKDGHCGHAGRGGRPHSGRRLETLEAGRGAGETYS